MQVDCKSQECDLSFVDVLILRLVRVDPLVACSIIEQVFVTVVRSVTVFFCSVCESHVVDMLTRIQVQKIARIMYSDAKLVAGSFMQKKCLTCVTAQMSKGGKIIMGVICQVDDQAGAHDRSLL